MRYPRTALALALVGMVAACQTQDTDGTAAATNQSADAAAAAGAGTPGTDEAKIAQAMSAAPDSIARAATIMDWPASEGAEARELRAGTNGWVCYPSTPAPEGAVGQDPMCLDPVFQRWAGAWMGRTDPNITSVGFAYMMKGDRGASNTDPFATDSTSTNNWVRVGAHVMIVAPTATLASVPATPGATPWVMWKGTPYAHVMVPVQ